MDEANYLFKVTITYKKKIFQKTFKDRRTMELFANGFFHALKLLGKTEKDFTIKNENIFIPTLDSSVKSK